jgi:hypothetical protein
MVQLEPIANLDRNQQRRGNDMNNDDIARLAGELAAEMHYGYGIGDGKADLDDGRWVTVKAEPDGDAWHDLFDAECYGMLARAEGNKHYAGRYGTTRPPGFDGAAVLIRGDGRNLRDDYWWQPLFDVWGVSRAEWHGDPDRRRREVDNITELLTLGFSQFTVELHQGCQTCGTDVVADAHSMGGFEANMDHGHVVDVLTDMLAELLHTYP